MSDVCPGCGKNHDRLFSDLVLDLFLDLDDSVDPEERRELLVQLGTEFALDVQPDESIFPEELHALVDEVVKLRLVYEQAAARVARTIMDQVAHAVEVRARETPAEGEGNKSN
jgi:hypothetical protein